jgi:hypothetical protein
VKHDLAIHVDSLVIQSFIPLFTYHSSSPGCDKLYPLDGPNTRYIRAKNERMVRKALEQSVHLIMLSHGRFEILVCGSFCRPFYQLTR